MPSPDTSHPIPFPGQQYKTSQQSMKDVTASDTGATAPTRSGGSQILQQPPPPHLKIHIRIPERLQGSSAAPVMTETTTPLPSRTATSTLREDAMDKRSDSKGTNTGGGGTTHTKTRSTASFSVCVECTSVTLSPMGHCIVAGFADGTVRLFDVTETPQSSSEGNTGRSKWNGGVVAARICAKGVHTSLRLQVATSGSWCFAGAVRGSTELLALRLHEDQAPASPTAVTSLSSAQLHNVPVHRHSDAKLRGFGACHKLAASDTYLLLTGKAIKNIHIWSFQPPIDDGASILANGDVEASPVWQCLYDCPTNGNTIKWLQFRRSWDASKQKSILQAISKSEGQKLRVWDVSIEEDLARSPTRHGKDETRPSDILRPQRPPFYDVANTESAMGIAGDLVVCGGSVWFNQMSIVSLDITRPPSSASRSVVDSSMAWYNHTELALPASCQTVGSTIPTSTSVSRRTQRGDVQCVVDTAGMEGHVLVQLSDGTVAAYQPQSSHGGVVPLAQIGVLPTGHVRQLGIHSVPAVAGEDGSQCHTVVTMATYNPLAARGSISLLTLSGNDGDSTVRETSPQKNVTAGTLLLGKGLIHQTPSTDISRPACPNGAVVTTAKKHTHSTTIRPSPLVGTASLPPGTDPVSTTKKKKNYTVTTPSDDRIKINLVLPTPQTLSDSTRHTPNSLALSAPFIRRLPSAKNAQRVVSSNKSMTHSPRPGTELITRVLKPTLNEVKSPLPNASNARIASREKDVAKNKHNPKSRQASTPTTEARGSMPRDVTCPTMSAPKSQPKNGGKDPQYIERSKPNSTMPSVSHLSSIPRKRSNPAQSSDTTTAQPNTGGKRRMFSLGYRDRLSNSHLPDEADIERQSQFQETKSFPVPSSVSKSKASTGTKSKQNDLGDLIREQCQAKLVVLQILEDAVPRQTFWERHGNQTECAAKCSDRCELDQFRLTSQHRATHEVIRRRVIEAARHTIWSVYESPALSSIEKAKRVLAGVVQGYMEETVRAICGFGLPRTHDSLSLTVTILLLGG
jgi:hypothetical protein